MINNLVREMVSDVNPDALFADGFDSALIGYVHIPPSNIVALYDYAKMIMILVNRDKMSTEDADEFLHFNTLGAYVGPNTPAYAVIFKRL